MQIHSEKTIEQYKIQMHKKVIQAVKLMTDRGTQTLPFGRVSRVAG